MILELVLGVPGLEDGECCQLPAAKEHDRCAKHSEPGFCSTIREGVLAGGSYAFLGGIAWGGRRMALVSVART